MVFNVTFYNISVIFWRSVFLVEKSLYWIKPPNSRKSLTNFISTSYGLAYGFYVASDIFATSFCYLKKQEKSLDVPV